MKPIILKMCGWGSYPEEIVIDFTKFYNENIFLISGPTGAGKTTIFDAISFSLFGNVSGKLREKASVRSDFAQLDIETYVELKFSHKEKEYTIKRTPKYTRPRKRGDGNTVSAETAELYIEEEIPVMVIKDVDRRISGILGMNYEQFKQTSMIAQGEFMELLVSPSKDKVEIFRNLFKTEKYDKVQRILNDKLKKQYGEIQNLKSKMEEAVHSIDGGSNEVLSEEIKGEFLNYNKILLLIEEYTSKDKINLENYSDKVGELDGLIKNAMEVIMEGERTNEELAKLADLEIKWVLLQESQSQIEKFREEVKRGSGAKFVEGEEKLYLVAAETIKKIQSQQTKYETEISRLEPIFLKCSQDVSSIEVIQNEIASMQGKCHNLEGFLPMLEDLEVGETKLKQVSEKLKKQKKESKGLLEKEKDHTEQLEAYEKQVGSFRFLEKEKGEVSVKLQLSREELQKQEIALMEFENLVLNKKDLKKCQTMFQRAEEELEAAKGHYGRQEAVYKNAAVGLVARFIKENEPCPVCGSTEHPHIAQVSDDVPDEKELEELKNQVGKKEKKYNVAYQKAAEQKAEMESREKQLVLLLKGLSLEYESEEKSRVTLINKGLSLQSELDLLLLKEKDLIEKELKKGELEKSIQEIKVLLHKLLAQKEKNVERAHELLQEEAVTKSLLEQILKKLPENFIKEKENIRKDIQDLTERIQESNDKIETIRKEYELVKSKLENQKTLFIKSKVDLEEEDIVLKEKEKTFLDTCLNYGFKNQEDYKLSVRSEKEIEALQKNIKGFERELQSVQISKENLKDQIKQKQYVDVDELKLQLAAREEEKKKLLEKKEEIAARLTGNNRAKESIVQKNKKREELEIKFGRVKELEAAANGTNKGRLVFEQYVLASYMEDILHATNSHLSKMTGGRYELMRVEKVADARTKDSLDLEVLDNYTGKKRSVKTLSGGESFKAALSLALGLSDAVQNYAGGIQIDTLFIDEGFGSLDTESLNQAIDTIASLTEHNRMIGIISHVNELKERFDNQIQVEKGTIGSKLKVIGV